jgi:O-antigen/teichoic acid export membrane protein
VNFRSARYSALNIAALAVQLGLISYFVLFVEASVKSVLIGRLGGTIFEAALFFWAVRSELTLAFSLSETRKMLSFGLPLVAGQLLATLFVMVDRFFLEGYGKLRDVGVYSISNSIVSVVAVLVTLPFNQVWTVMRFSVMDEEGAEAYYSRVLTYVVLVSMYLTLCVSAVAGDALMLKAQRSYWAAGSIIPLLGFAAVLDCASGVLNVGITLKKRTIFSPLVTGGALVANLGMNFMLIPRFGIMGATVSTLLSYLIFCGLRFWASNLFIKINYEWRRVLTAASAGAVMIAAFYLVDYLRGSDASHATIYASILAKGLLALSFPLQLHLLRFYQDGELQRVARFARLCYYALRPGAREQAPQIEPAK